MDDEDWEEDLDDKDEAWEAELDDKNEDLWEASKGDEWGNVADDDESSVTNLAPTGKGYETLSPKDVDKMMEDTVAEFGNMLGSEPPYEDARLLLEYYGWDAERATTEYFMGDQKNTRINAGLDPAKTQMELVEEEVECPICLDDLPSHETRCLTCGHSVCTDCWSSYIIQASKSKNCFKLRCPMDGCEVAATVTRLRQINVNVTPLSILEKKISRFRRKHFTESNSRLQHCLGVDCPLTQRYLVPRKELRDVKCNCGYVYCTKCLLQGHRPCPCDLADVWLAKATSEAENMQWIIARTKKCPRCRVPIEKNQGCNHMTCQSCRHEFCWLCKGDWKDHGTATGGFYKCNIYEKNKLTGATSAEEQAQADANTELERYTFHYTRYENHMNSIKEMQKTLEVAESRMGELMSKYNIKPNEVSFIKDSANTITDCRRLLAWTYPVGYYMEENFAFRHLFLNYQQNLEKFTEHLHELAEQPLESFKDPNVRTEMINYQRVAHKYRDNLLQGIENEINPKCKFSRQTSDFNFQNRK